MIKLLLKTIYSLINGLYFRIFHGLKLQSGTIIHWPKKIEGGNHFHIGKNAFIGSDAWLCTFSHYNDQVFNPSINIADEVSIGRYSCIACINEINIGFGCLISEYFYVSDHTHGFDPMSDKIPAKQNLYSKGAVSIGERCFIGYRVSVLPGVMIGKGCVIGSNSVVTRNIPDYSMAAGVPAKVIKKFNFETKQWETI